MSCIADFSWTFSLPREAAGLSEKEAALVQHAVRAYAAARDSDEENGTTLAEKLDKAKAKVLFPFSKNCHQILDLPILLPLSCMIVLAYYREAHALQCLRQYNMSRS